jgi:ABC-type transport system substrate-binding protein
MLVSPCNAEALKYDRDALMFHPSGTGPYRAQRLVPHERLELLRNDDYWDKERVPKRGKLVPIPIPEASTRASALLAGPVNFIEAPDPDAIPRLNNRHRRSYGNFFGIALFARTGRVAPGTGMENDLMNTMPDVSDATASCGASGEPPAQWPGRFVFDPEQRQWLSVGGQPSRCWISRHLLAA